MDPTITYTHKHDEVQQILNESAEFLEVNQSMHVNTSLSEDFEWPLALDASKMDAVEEKLMLTPRRVADVSFILRLI
jgi:hypothetical protein